MKRIITTSFIFILLIASVTQIMGAELPDETQYITRYEFVKMINDSFQLTQVGEKRYKDIPIDSDVEKEFAIAYYISGYDNGTARPNDYLAKSEASSILSRICALSIYTFDINLDGHNSPMWASENIKSAVRAGFFELDDNFNPNDFVTKIEASELIAKIEANKYNQRRIDYSITIPSFDGYSLKGRLSMPEDGVVDKLIIFVNGSGPNTYLNKRILDERTFNYFDLFASEFTKTNNAFFSYSTRGVSIGTQPPAFVDIDDEEYNSYLPSNQVKDVKAMIQYLTSTKELQNCEVYLLGWSEGASIAPMVALDKEVQVDGLYLAGYYNNGLKDVLDWQQSGAGSMINYKLYFNVQDRDYISRQDYETDPNSVVSLLFDNASFDSIDINKDEKISQEDLEILLKDNRNNLFAAIENNNDEWIANNYPVHLTSAWFKEHFELEPNKDILPLLDIPIHIFQGTLDTSASAENTFEIAESFKNLGKDNLVTHVFDQHDHDLNYMLYPRYNEISEGLRAMFDVSQ